MHGWDGIIRVGFRRKIDPCIHRSIDHSFILLSAYSIQHPAFNNYIDMYAMTNHRLLSWMTAATVLMVSCCLQVTSGADCTLNCPNDAPCQIGAGDFSAHTTANIEQTYGSMHCGCPYGWTGVLCDHKYETCDNNHKCYHGGECVPGMKDKYGNDQLFCDCSNAVMSDGTKYVGKYCETPFEKICDDEGNDFCVNGGDCNPEYP